METPIIQWGVIAGKNSWGSQTIQLPISFPNRCVWAGRMMTQTGNWSDSTNMSQRYYHAVATIYPDSSTSELTTGKNYGGFYCAIGYQ